MKTWAGVAESTAVIRNPSTKQAYNVLSVSRQFYINNFDRASGCWVYIFQQFSFIKLQWQWANWVSFFVVKCFFLTSEMVHNMNLRFCVCSYFRFILVLHWKHMELSCFFTTLALGFKALYRIFLWHSVLLPFFSLNYLQTLPFSDSAI